jgi:hypothetical protein
MVRKRLTYILTAFLMMVLISNYTPVKGFLDLKQVYRYSTLQRELQTSERPFKGCDYSCVEMVLEEFKQKHPQTTDTTLYRTFTRNPIIFWRWHEYLFHPRYKLPYLHLKNLEQESL